MPARVLAIAQTSELGGAEYGLLRIARRLPERGFEVEVAAPEPGPLLERAREASLRVHLMAVGALSAGAWPRAVLSWPRARQLMRAVRPDLVYLNGTVAQRLAPAFAGAPLVLHVHDLLEVAPRPWRSDRFWRATPIVLCDSQAVARASAAVGAPEERLRVVHCPVDPPVTSPRPEWANGVPIVGYVGRVEPRKGTLDLMHAARLLLDRRPDARVVLVGADSLGASSEYADRVREEADGLGDRVLMLGAIEEARALMPWFDVLCVPSRSEPFGTVAAEALAAGTPVVATDSGGMAEYVVPGRNGALVPPGEPQALAEALDGVLGRGDELAAAARSDAEPFASDRVADAVAAGLREALEWRA